MENKVYYGEYSLKHWIGLMLKGNVSLPDYQRCFVWSEEEVKTLIDSLKEKQFIPPVTIGAFMVDGDNKNLILDGQQRLTSILLAYIGLYPDQKAYKKSLEKLANDNDDEEEQEDIEPDNILEWTSRFLIEKGKNKQEILSVIQKEQKNNYKEMPFNIDNIIDSTFLGFSYLVPSTQDSKKQQEYYSSVFRNINIQGRDLLPQESRRSFYFLDDNLAKLFEPDFCKEITLNNGKLDFVRYLSLLFQYCKDNKIYNVAKNYGRHMEEYYEIFIYSSVGKDDSSMFKKISDVFTDNEYQATIDILQESIKFLEIKTFSSIIDADMYLLGLVYEVVFNKKKIDPEKKDRLKNDLDSKTKELKADSSHAKTPSLLKYLRGRLASSLEIYGKSMI
jgi:uncharacterized protein with ParB-like and HNH nuclease domain